MSQTAGKRKVWDLDQVDRGAQMKDERIETATQTSVKIATEVLC